MSDQIQNVRYTMSEDALIGVMDECEIQAEVAMFMLGMPDLIKDDDYKMSLLCESFSTCYKLRIEIANILQYRPTQQSENQELQYLLTEEDIRFLQTGIMTKMLVTRDLLVTANISSAEH